MADWKAVVKSVAPVLGTALGGPLAGAAVKAIAEKALGVSGAAEVEVAASIVSASPEVLERLRKADQDFQYQMAKLGVDVFALEVQDRGGARELYKLNRSPQIVLSGGVVAGFFAALFYVLSGWAHATGTDQAAWLMLGGLGTAFTQVLNFWFGSTNGSQAKTNLIAQANAIGGGK